MAFPVFVNFSLSQYCINFSHPVFSWSIQDMVCILFFPQFFALLSIIILTDYNSQVQELQHPWLPVSPWLRESAGLFPASPSLCCGQENLSKKKSWDNCKAYFVCFLFLGITFLCHLISSFLETIISYFLFLCVRKVSTLLLYLGWKSECHIWINFCELFWILRAED